MQPRYYMTFFNNHSNQSYYSHPEIRVYVEEVYANCYMNGREILSITWQSDGDKNFSFRQAYAPRINVPFTYERQYAKKLVNGLLNVDYPSLKNVIKILHKHKVEKRRYMDIGKGDVMYAKEAVPVKCSQFAEAWWKAKEVGKNLTVTGNGGKR